MNIEAYFDRIQYLKIETKEEQLKFITNLQESQIMSIAFENLDIIDNKQVNLDIDSIFDKVITQKRGGICYELNGLFNELLVSLNFDSHLISADIFGSNEKGTHASILLTISNEKYIIDVGYGDISRQPIPLNGEVVKDISGTYMAQQINDKTFDIIKITNKNETKNLYRLYTNEKNLDDFDKALEYNTFSSESVFNKNKLTTLATPSGRVTLLNTKLIITNNDEKKIFEDVESNSILKKYFNISSS